MTSSAASPSSISVLTALLEARTGQQMAAYRSWRLDTALKPLLRDRNLETLDQLVTVMLEGNDRVIGDQIVDALLNQETSFFRDAAVYDVIVEAVAAAEARGERVRIWSAGCATGQEPLSLAMLFAERRQASGAPMPEIVGTDVSDAALIRARAGRFTQFEIQRGLPIRRMMRWFDSVDGDWVAKPELTKLVAYRRVNLVADRPPAGKFDIVLCRNVLLYLSTETKAGVFDRLADVMKPGGLFVMGAGETVIGQTRLFEPSRTYRGFYETGSAAKASAAARRFTSGAARAKPDRMTIPPAFAAPIIDTPSPNFDDRSLPVSMIVLHYTGMKDGASAIARLRDPEAKVSSHYLVAEDGTVLRMVDEADRAWHAGKSYWREVTDVNSASIGIEIVNPGHEFGYRPFAEQQIAALLPLVADIKERHGITRGNVVGHSDIAPARKQDPGELFPWWKLAKLRLALPRPTKNLMDPMWTEGGFLLALNRFGYDVSNAIAAIRAFQRRYRPEMIDGEIDAECRMILLALLLPKPMGDE